MTPNLAKSLLVIEDSNEDFVVFMRVVRKSSIKNPIYCCCDGEDALDFLSHTGKYADVSKAPRPAMILLDLNLLGMDGREVLWHVKQNWDLRVIPIIVFTTSSNPTDVETCYQRGVKSYIVKPIDTAKLIWTVQLFISYWFEASVLPHQIEGEQANRVLAKE